LIAGGIGDLRPHPGELEEPGGIHGLEDAPEIFRGRPALLPQEQEVALPAPEVPRDPTLVMLAAMLGASLSTDNLAWRGNPVPVMRGLQKRLVEHSLTLPEGEREPAMRAIRAVESTVRWRLRWMQMKRSEAENQIIPSTENNPEQDEQQHAAQTNH